MAIRRRISDNSCNVFIKGWVDSHVGNTFATTAVHFNGRKKPISAQNFKTIAEMRVIYDLKKENIFLVHKMQTRRGTPI